MLLQSLSPSFRNFRCAIESRDTLPSPEALRVKIIDESEEQKQEMRENTTNTMMAKKSFNKKQGSKYKENQNRRKDESPNTANKETFKYKCHRCHKISHKASECNERSKNVNGANMANHLSLCAIASLRLHTNSDGSLEEQMNPTVATALRLGHGVLTAAAVRTCVVTRKIL